MGNVGQDDREQEIVVEVIHGQLQHFTNIVPPCRGMQLPDGVLLRHTLSPSLYFYLRTKIEDGKIKSRVFASDSPYDRQKAEISEVSTPMFDAKADQDHMEKLERLIREWVDFVGDANHTERDFQTFVMNDRSE
jgi:hypothetical protein